MIRSLSLVLCTAVGLVGCGSNTSSVIDPGTGGSGTGGSGTGGSGTGGSGGTGGSSSSAKTALDITPGDNTVSGWKIDRESNRNANGAPMTGATKKDVEGLIDGAATPFFIDPATPTLFLWQNYLNATLPAAQPDGAAISMYILQMPSAEQAKGLYKAVLSLSEYDRKKGTDDDWTATSPAVGTESRIQDTGSTWWINFYQGVFYVEIVLSPSTGPAPNYTPKDPDTKAEAVRFAKAVADKI